MLIIGIDSAALDPSGIDLQRAGLLCVRVRSWHVPSDEPCTMGALTEHLPGVGAGTGMAKDRLHRQAGTHEA